MYVTPLLIFDSKSTKHQIQRDVFLCQYKNFDILGSLTEKGKFLSWFGIAIFKVC